ERDAQRVDGTRVVAAEQQQSTDVRIRGEEVRGTTEHLAIARQRLVDVAVTVLPRGQPPAWLEAVRAAGDGGLVHLALLFGITEPLPRASPPIPSLVVRRIEETGDTVFLERLRMTLSVAQHRGQRAVGLGAKTVETHRFARVRLGPGQPGRIVAGGVLAQTGGGEPGARHRGVGLGSRGGL